MSFTGASFINDCLLQSMLHVSHPLFQFAGITDPVLTTAAWFSRFQSCDSDLSYLGGLMSEFCGFYACHRNQQ